MHNRKYNCKKREEKQLIVCTLALLHNKCNIMLKLHISNQSMWWRFIRKYRRSNYTIYRMNYSKGNVGAASLSDMTGTTGNTMPTRSAKKLVQRQIQSSVVATHRRSSLTCCFTTLGAVF